jgi:hypothetical protein
MPYRNPDKPYVNYWFHTSDGGGVESFNELLTEENIDRLEQESGVCLVYTHFGKGFYKDGEINSRTRELLTGLASRNGWFAPASEILDYLQKQNPNDRQLSFRNEVRLELYWMWEKL